MALVDLSTFEDVEVLRFGKQLRQLLCEGDQILAVAGPSDDKRVYDVRTGDAVTGRLVRPKQASLVDGQLNYPGAADAAHPKGWHTLDLVTGLDRFVAEMSRTGPFRVESVGFSPDGERVAYAVKLGNNDIIDYELVNFSDGRTVSRRVSGHIGIVRWLDPDRLLLLQHSGGFPNTDPHFVVGHDLGTLYELDGTMGWATHLDSEHLIGLNRGAFQRAPLAGGPVEVVNEIPGDRRLIRLPEPIEMATIGSASREPIETPISSPVIEAIAVPSLVEPEPTPTIMPARATPTSGQVAAESGVPPGPPALEGEAAAGSTSDSALDDSRVATIIGVVIGAVSFAAGSAFLLRRRRLNIDT